MGGTTDTPVELLVFLAIGPLGVVFLAVEAARLARRGAIFVRGGRLIAAAFVTVLGFVGQSHADELMRLRLGIAGQLTNWSSEKEAPSLMRGGISASNSSEVSR